MLDNFLFGAYLGSMGAMALTAHKIKNQNEDQEAI